MFIRKVAQASARAGTLVISLWASAASSQSQAPVKDGFSAARANADNPRNLRKLHFTEVKNTAENRLKYPFIKDDFTALKRDKATQETKVYVAEIKDPNITDVFLKYDEGPSYCGIYCEFDAYHKTKNGFNLTLQWLARAPAYLQTCPNETSMINSGGSLETGNPNLSNVTQWIYSGGKFEYKATYRGLDKVPACGADTNAGAPGVNAGTLTVYGETVKVAPCSRGYPGSSFAWEDVKAYLPPEILRAPKAPMGHEQIVAALKELSRKSGTLAAEEITRFVPVYKEQNKDDKNDPFAELMEAFSSDHGADALHGVNADKVKATEKQIKEAIALVCVQYAVMGTQPQ